MYTCVMSSHFRLESSQGIPLKTVTLRGIPRGRRIIWKYMLSKILCFIEVNGSTVPKIKYSTEEFSRDDRIPEDAE